MALFGILENIKGAVIPPIRAEFNVPYSSIGLLLFISSGGYLLAVFFGGLVAERVGKKSVLATGYCIIILAIILLDIKSFPLLVLLFFLINIGFGCFEISLNSLGAQIFLPNPAVMMSFLHLFYGIGSTIGPRYAGALLFQGWPWRYTFYLVLLPLFLLVVMIIFARFPKLEGIYLSRRLPLGEVFSDKKIWLFVGVLGFCMVFEIGIGNWLINFLQVVRGMNENSSSAYMSIFFLVFTAGRLLGGFFAEKLGYVQLIFLAVLASALLFSGGLFLEDASILFSLTGFFISFLFPTVISITIRTFPQGSSSVMALIITAAGAINMLGNWIIGRINDFFGVFAGFSAILIAPLMVLLFLVFLHKKLSSASGASAA